MPDFNSLGKGALTAPIATYTTTVQINSGTAIAAGTSITESYTFTGVLTTDTRVGLAYRDATVIPKGLQLTSLIVTATNTLTATWRNTTAASITPPASATWTAIVYGLFVN